MKKDLGNSAGNTLHISLANIILLLFYNKALLKSML